MKQRIGFLVATALGVVACSVSGGAGVETLTMPHPDDSSLTVEYFLEKPSGSGPWPTVAFLHGHQESPRAGGRDFVRWGVLDRFAKRGYLAVAVSQPGYGGSTGQPDFCGPRTQNAISGVIALLQAEGFVSSKRVVIVGISRGALVAGFIAARDPSIAGLVLISGLYDLSRFVADASSPQARRIVNSIVKETGGGADALRARSLLNVAHNITAAALIMNGAQDDRTDPEQAGQLADKIGSSGGKARAIIYPDYGHQIPVSVREKEIDVFIESVIGR